MINRSEVGSSTEGSGTGTPPFTASTDCSAALAPFGRAGEVSICWTLDAEIGS